MKIFYKSVFKEKSMEIREGTIGFLFHEQNNEWFPVHKSERRLSDIYLSPMIVGAVTVYVAEKQQRCGANHRHQCAARGSLAANPQRAEYSSRGS